MEEDFGSYLGGIAYGLAIGAVIGIAAYQGCSSRRAIPNVKEVEQGFIAPNTLEVKCMDMNANGKFETIIKIGEKPYLLKEIDGKPMLIAYEIKPIETKDIE